MGLEISRDSNSARVDVQDEMTIYTAALQRDQLLPLLAQVRHMTLDLSSVVELDSAGVQLLLMLKRESDRLHNTFELAALSSTCSDVLKLLRLEPVFAQAPSCADEDSNNG